MACSDIIFATAFKELDKCPPDFEGAMKAMETIDKAMAADIKLVMRSVRDTTKVFPKFCRGRLTHILAERAAKRQDKKAVKKHCKKAMKLYKEVVDECVWGEGVCAEATAGLNRCDDLLQDLKD